MKKLIVRVKTQTADLYEQDRLLKTYVISTARNGIGREKGSYCTPSGRLLVAQKIGEGMPLGTVFRGRKPTAESWSIESSEDFVLTRILWLEGGEEKNTNTLERLIYLHGTNQEHLLGTPASHGCIRFSNADICEIFDELGIGSEVYVTEF